MQSMGRFLQLTGFLFVHLLGTRTTNHLEGWQWALIERVKPAHVKISDLIEHLKRGKRDLKNQRLLLDAGNPPPIS